MSVDPLEVFGLVSGVLCVWLLIRQNIWTFPIGLAYAVASVLVMSSAKLYADTLLSGYYVLINAYGWWYWLRGGDAARRQGGESLPVIRTPGAEWSVLALVSVAGVVIMAVALLRFTDAELVWLDSTTTVLSFVAMWMTARKYLENWVVWWVVDVIATGMYIYKGIWPYALLYALYLGMAVWGYRAWRADLAPRPQASLAR